MPSPGTQQDDGEKQSDQSIIKIDPDGDLTLVVGRTKTRFLVCSKTLSRSSPFWNRCLYGQFKEAKSAGVQEWVVEFPEDNPAGLECLLLLVHGLGHKMPEIDLQLAFEICVLTNKYRMTQSLWAVAGSWLQDLKPFWPNGGDDATVVPQLQWLWVTKELGDLERHKDTRFKLSQIVSITPGQDSHLLIRPYKAYGADALTPDTLEGYDAEKDIILLLSDEIKTIRRQALSVVQDSLKISIKNLQIGIKAFDSALGCKGARLCKAQEPAKQRLCEYAMQGIITKMSAGKDSVLKPVGKMVMSVNHYLASALYFTSRVEKELAFVSGKEHENCSPFIYGLPDHEDLKHHTQWTWSLTVKGEFKMQALLSGLVKAGGGVNNDDEGQGTSGSRIAPRKRSRNEFEAPTAE